MPSFRDPASQLRANQWSWYGKLLKYLTTDCAQDDGLQQALQKVKTEGDRVFKEVTDKIHNEDLAVSFPGAKVSLQFNSDTKTDIYKSCVIYVNDGFKSLLTAKGSGIQSATIIGLFAYYTKHVNTQSSALLCIEEPELYLHPHARRSISDRLDNFLEGDRNQVIVTTHAVEFLRTIVKTFTLLLVKKDETGTTIARSLDAKEFLPLLINNNQNEMFFADKVILCEGFNEYILRAAVDEIYPGELDRQNVSIISVQGKDNLVRMVKTVMDLDLQCFIAADFDFLLRDKNPPKDDYLEELIYDTKPHESLASLRQDFFTQACTFGGGGAAIRTKIQAIRARLKTNAEQLFYEAKHASELADVEVNVLLPQLRQSGCCILDGQIENLVKPGWMSGNKIGLTQVYQIREQYYQ